jgi:hypothetical protein
MAKLRLMFSGQEVEIMERETAYTSNGPIQIASVKCQDADQPWIATVCLDDLYLQEDDLEVSPGMRDPLRQSLQLLSKRWNGYLQSNGMPLVVAINRGDAQKMLNAWRPDEISSVSIDDVQAVIELSPKDRHPELVTLMKGGFLWTVA